MRTRKSSDGVTKRRSDEGGDPSLIGRRLRRGDFRADSETLAASLIGRLLVRQVDGELFAGRIVETEAYAGVEDRASHAFGGRRTERTEMMYAKEGTAYVYFTYGMHHCMNVVCGEEGVPLAVLIRALEPLVGLEKMREHRHARSKRKSGGEMSDTELCSGPARLCQALAIHRRENGLDLVTSEELWVAEPGRGVPSLDRSQIVRTARIGVAYAGDWAEKPLRFVVANSAFTSGKPVGDVKLAKKFR